MAPRTRQSAHPAVVAIRSESARVGWPTRFQTDLDHDERAITCPHGPITTPNGDKPFAWCLRDDGTHVITMPEVRRDGYPVADGRRMTCAMVAEAFGEEDCRFYVWNGSDLVSYRSSEECEDALLTLARDDREAFLRQISDVMRSDVNAIVGQVSYYPRETRLAILGRALALETERR